MAVMVVVAAVETVRAVAAREEAGAKEAEMARAVEEDRRGKGAGQDHLEGCGREPH